MFWIAVLLAGAVGAFTLHVLGPLPRPAAPVVADVPRPAAAWDGRVAAPAPGLLEPSRAFPPALLPRIAADGRTARTVYARPSPPGARPRVAIVVAGFGLSDADSRAAIGRLPGAVTLAFSAYTQNPEALLTAARASGHELLASLPMEPQNAPYDTAGDRALMTGATPGDNMRNLEWVLGRLQGYVGLTGASDGMRGERFAFLTTGFHTVLNEIAARGLLYLDPRPTEGRAGESLPGVPAVRTDLVLDDPPGRADIDAKLVALERLARERGSAVGLAGPLRPVTIEKIAAWAKAAEARGIVLVPISALTTTEPGR